jgi:hypothetical protein
LLSCATGKGGAFIGGPVGALAVIANLDQFKDRETFSSEAKHLEDCLRLYEESLKLIEPGLRELWTITTGSVPWMVLFERVTVAKFIKIKKLRKCAIPHVLQILFAEDDLDGLGMLPGWEWKIAIALDDDVQYSGRCWQEGRPIEF